MNYNFSSEKELKDIINGINRNFYCPAIENIAFLEEVASSNKIKYMEQLRDAYSHLVRILCLDIRTSKDEIKGLLVKYCGHLERLALDTIRKIVDHTLNARLLPMMRSTRERNSMNAQIAVRIKDLRIVGDMSCQERYSAYVQLQKELEKIITEF